MEEGYVEGEQRVMSLSMHGVGLQLCHQLWNPEKADSLLSSSYTVINSGGIPLSVNVSGNLHRDSEGENGPGICIPQIDENQGLGDPRKCLDSSFKNTP